MKNNGNRASGVLQLTLLCALASCLSFAATARAEIGFLERVGGFLGNTHLLELEQGSRLSNMVNGLQIGGFETSEGNWIGFKKWYSSNWTDARAAWVTQLTPSWGVIWGGSTGERAEKYSISPSLKLGFVFQTPVQKNAFVSLKGTTVVGGRLKEKSCVADYGEIGGVQEVNCRLAATPLEPSETLNYNLNERPYRHALMLRFTKFF